MVEQIQIEEDNMAVEQITFKKITKFNVDDPNFKQPPQPEPEEVDGNVVEEDMYGERKHTYQPDNGNLQMNEFMTGVLNKLDGLTVNPDIVKKSRAVKVDILRNINLKENHFSIIFEEIMKARNITDKFCEIPYILGTRDKTARPTKFRYGPITFWNYLKYLRF